MLAEQFEHPTYVILPIKEPVAAQIRRIREQYAYPLEIPVEVTVAGSSGIGVVDPGQDPKLVIQELEAIAAEIAPFTTDFGPVCSFPNTSVFWFSLRDEKPFHQLHTRLKASKIEFQESLFPYQPHCTIQGRPRTEAEISAILKLNSPGKSLFDTLALASMISREGQRLECPVLWAGRLNGTMQP